MKKCILLYGFNNFYTDQIRKAFMMRDFEVRAVPREQYGWLLGELTGEMEVMEEHDENLDIPGKMLVISGISQAEIADTFALLYQTTGKLQYHKAVVTETNKNWTSARLFMEVDREYREISRRQKIRR